MNNDKIKELLEKSGFRYVKDDGIGWAGDYNSSLPKFAELIVRECAEQSMSIGRYNTPSGVTPDLSIAIAVGLKKHFGVKDE